MWYWLGGLLFVGIKKLVLYLLGVHAFLLFVLAVLILLFILMWEFRKRHRGSVYNLDSDFEPSLTPAAWVLASAVIPELRLVGAKTRKYKIGRLCWN